MPSQRLLRFFQMFLLTVSVMLTKIHEHVPPVVGKPGEHGRNYSRQKMDRLIGEGDDAHQRTLRRDP